MSKQKPIMMADVRDYFFPQCCAENRNDGKNDNRPILRAFREGRIVGVPTRFKVYTINGRKERRVVDFRIERAEWKRLFREGINHPIDADSEVAV